MNKLWVVNSKTDVHHILDGVKVLIIQWNIVFRISWMIMKTKKENRKLGMNLPYSRRELRDSRFRRYRKSSRFPVIRISEELYFTSRI